MEEGESLFLAMHRVVAHHASKDHIKEAKTKNRQHWLNSADHKAHSKVMTDGKKYVREERGLTNVFR